MRVFQTRHVGAAPTCRTNPTSSRSVREHARHFAEVEARGANPRGSTTSKDSVADTERHLSCKQVHVGAKPTGGSISNAFHGVTAALLFVGETESGQHRLRSPISNVRTAKSSSQWCASPLYPVQVWGARPVSSDTREPANSLGLGPRQARGSTGVSDHFIGL
jgi:hypothetical protein